MEAKREYEKMKLHEFTQMKADGLNWLLEQFEAFCVWIVDLFSVTIDGQMVKYSSSSMNAAGAATHDAINSITDIRFPSKTNENEPSALFCQLSKE